MLRIVLLNILLSLNECCYIGLGVRVDVQIDVIVMIIGVKIIWFSVCLVFWCVIKWIFYMMKVSGIVQVVLFMIIIIGVVNDVLNCLSQFCVGVLVVSI